MLVWLVACVIDCPFACVLPGWLTVVCFVCLLVFLLLSLCLFVVCLFAYMFALFV